MCIRDRSSDRGDFYTVASYPEERFGKDVPHLRDGLRATDTIDFRPRVGAYGGTGSPFAFSNRNFNDSSNPTTIVTPNESSIIGYNFYLPRIDKVILDSGGDVVVITGESSTNPTPISVLDNAMVLATIELLSLIHI